MYLSYSGYKKADACLYAYWHVYVNHTPYGKLDDRLGSIYGIVVGTLFEQFYNEKLWRTPGVQQEMESRVEALVDKTLAEEVKPKKGRSGGVIMWQGRGEGQNPKALYCDREELIRDVTYAIGVGLKTIKYEKLIGKDVVAELKLDSLIKGHLLGGRADLVLTKVETQDRLIVDGKGSNRRDKYVDPGQLKWYSFLHRARFGSLPDKTAFLYWKYESPMNMDWFMFTEAEVDDFLFKVLKTIGTIESGMSSMKDREDIPETLSKPLTEKSMPIVREIFKPSATTKNCMFCPYATEIICPEGFVKREAHERKLAERDT